MIADAQAMGEPTLWVMLLGAISLLVLFVGGLVVDRARVAWIGILMWTLGVIFIAWEIRELRRTRR